MDTSNRPCGVAGFQSNGLKIHVWTVRFCPWAPRSKNHREVTRIARAVAGGSLSLRRARALFGVAESLRATRATGPLSRSGWRSALGGAS